MNTRQDQLTQAEAIELVQKELDLSWSKAFEWLMKHFGSVTGLSRSAVEAETDKIKAVLSKFPRRQWDDEKDDEDELSL